jgi:hypothetical protein
MTRSVLIAAVLALLAVPATSQAITDNEITAALNASPCKGQPITVLWDTSLEAQGYGATASGAHYTDDTESEIVFDRCEITRNPTDWAALNRAERCIQDLHELLHLAGRLHEPTGIMAHKWEDRGWYAPCHTLRERVRHDVAGLVPAGAQVACGKWQGQSFVCRTDWASAKGGSRRVDFRVKTRGDAYAIRRVRLAAYYR